jgi:hypothetical protein
VRVGAFIVLIWRIERDQKSLHYDQIKENGKADSQGEGMQFDGNS